MRQNNSTSRNHFQDVHLYKSVNITIALTCCEIDYQCKNIKTKIFNCNANKLKKTLFYKRFVDNNQMLLLALYHTTRCTLKINVRPCSKICSEQTMTEVTNILIGT